MLDKTKINNLRDLLVGVVPNPVDQVKQITIALVYKFMNDMDDFNQNFAGKRIYFVKDYAQFAWSKLMDDKLTNLERLNLYADALQQIELNKDIPDVFQHIFKGAFLSYRNPETLTLFLKEISGFDYNQDSEQLGDAFEYLLSILGSQKDAGQFRTPRHIIDFMVKVIKPTKNDSILDPACGTAGFLISAFQYIRDTANLQLSEFSQVFNNIYGYDITPDMVKIALINLYLHRDTNPHIYEYDTLSNDEKWGDKFNVILANPPFMTPKGGIKPHSKFRLKATKSEVLFCDYILEHLRFNGRAGIVVPEGIIFQSGNVYKQLREMLVMGENNQGNLIAAISLPSGVFKPYSGVKTSILIIDKQAAKAKENILLVKINNDGYDLGDKRNPVTANDLPHALELIEYYQQHNQLPEDSPFSTSNAQLISKQQLKENDFNLSFDRYKTSATQLSSHYPMVRLGNVCEFINGYAFKPDDWKVSGVPIVRIQNLTGTNKNYNFTDRQNIPEKYLLQNNDLLISWSASIGFYIWKEQQAYLNQHIFRVINSDKINKMYLFYLKNFIVKLIHDKTHGNTMQHITKGDFEDIEIPLPPIEVQQKIVAEIEQYQKVIDGAKLIVDNYKPKININPEWQVVKLGNAVEFIDGDRGSNYPKKEDFLEDGYCLFLNTKNVTNKGFNFNNLVYISQEKDQLLRKGKLSLHDIVMTTRGTLGNIAFVTKDIINRFGNIRINSGMVIIRPHQGLYPEFVYTLLQLDSLQVQFQEISSGSAQPQLPIRDLSQVDIFIPPLEEQQKIVSELEHERKLVDNAKQLIDIMQNKINFTISQLWSVPNIAVNESDNAE
jgi:type I restriction enzyme M protein